MYLHLVFHQKIVSYFLNSLTFYSDFPNFVLKNIFWSWVSIRLVSVGLGCAHCDRICCLPFDPPPEVIVELIEGRDNIYLMFL